MSAVLLWWLSVASFALTDEASKTAGKVAGDSILVSEVDREIAIAYRDRPIAEGAKDDLRAHALEQLIKRRLILRWLAETKQAATPEEIGQALQQLEQRLTQRGITLAKYLEDQQLDETGLRRSLAWQLGWQRYLDKQLTEKNLERYFDQHRREFDGTRLHLAQILFKIDSSANPTAVQSTRDRAKQVLASIQAGSISFADAARKHSDSPSRDAGGDIGWIGRHEPMPESFSSAAFQLEPMQISQPVVTTFGLHLIQCLEVKAGDKHWRDVQPELERAVTMYLFDWVAEQARPRVEVEYSPGFPRVKAE